MSVVPDPPGSLEDQGKLCFYLYIMLQENQVLKAVLTQVQILTPPLALWRKLESF